MTNKINFIVRASKKRDEHSLVVEYCESLFTFKIKKAEFYTLLENRKKFCEALDKKQMYACDKRQKEYLEQLIKTFLEEIK
jgi:hypothetical protein